ncbi:MAG: hypothetical protein ACJ8AH_07860 [Stellaceae bacterium]
MEKRIARSVRQFDKPKASFGFEPFDDGTYRWAGWRFESRRAEARRGSKISKMRVISIVVEVTAAALTEIPISDQVSFLSSRFTAHEGRGNRLFQKIDAGASGLIMTMFRNRAGRRGPPNPPCSTRNSEQLDAPSPALQSSGCDPARAISTEFRVLDHLVERSMCIV